MPCGKGVQDRTGFPYMPGMHSFDTSTLDVLPPPPAQWEALWREAIGSPQKWNRQPLHKGTLLIQ